MSVIYNGNKFQCAVSQFRLLPTPLNLPKWGDLTTCYD